MLNLFFSKFIDPWKSFFFFLFVANFMFLLNTEWILFFTLIFIFLYLLYFLILNFNNLINNEKIIKFKLFILLIDEIKKNFFFLNKINYQILNLLLIIINFLNIYYTTNIFYKCIRIPKIINYLFNYIEESIFLVTDVYREYNYGDLLLIKQNFLDY